MKVYNTAKEKNVLSLCTNQKKRPRCSSPLLRWELLGMVCFHWCEEQVRAYDICLHLHRKLLEGS